MASWSYLQLHSGKTYRKAVTPQLLATAKVHWLDSDHGGRKAPPFGPIYAATGRFADQGDNELFSVVLRFPLKKASRRQLTSGSLGFMLLEQAENKPAAEIVDEVELGFFAPELIEKKLAPGVKLLITEGQRIVAECEIQSVIPYKNKAEICAK